MRWSSVYFPRGGLGLPGEVVPGEVVLGGVVELAGGVVVVEPGIVVVVPGGVVVVGDVVEFGEVVLGGTPTVELPGTQGLVAEAVLFVPVGELLDEDEVVELEGWLAEVLPEVPGEVVELFDVVELLEVVPELLESEGTQGVVPKVPAWPGEVVAAVPVWPGEVVELAPVCPGEVTAGVVVCLGDVVAGVPVVVPGVPVVPAVLGALVVWPAATPIASNNTLVERKYLCIWGLLNNVLDWFIRDGMHGQGNEMARHPCSCARPLCLTSEGLAYRYDIAAIV
jgi:hypothetical protein